jgi:hypothetical protein
MTSTLAFALSPGWWIIVAVAIVLVLSLAYSLSSARGSGITPRRYKRPRSATPAPGARGPAHVSGRDDMRETWEQRRPPRTARPPAGRGTS